MARTEDLFVRSVEGHIVGRFGSRGQNIGVEFVYVEKPGTGGAREYKGVKWIDRIERIPLAQYEIHSGDYNRALADGSLKECTKAEFEAQEKKIAEDAKAEAKKAEAERKAAEKKAAEEAKKAEAHASVGGDVK